jgi:hypothetical protein
LGLRVNRKEQAVGSISGNTLNVAASGGRIRCQWVAPASLVLKRAKGSNSPR